MNKPEMPFLVDFFTVLNGRSIDYAVMRNAESLPHDIGNTDVDMLVNRGSRSAVARIVVETCERNGGGVYSRTDTGFFTQLQLLGRTGEIWWGVCIDLFDDVLYRDTVSIIREGVLKLRVQNAYGVWTFGDDVAHLIGFAKEWLINGKRSDRYSKRAEVAVDNGLADKVLSAEISSAVVNVLKGKWESPRKYRRSSIGYLLGKLKRYLRPSGHCIVVLGTDGSGKSTLLDAISKVLKMTVHNQLVIHHLKPDVLPPLGRLRGVKYESGHVCTNPHGSRPSGTLGSLFRITYLSADYILGHLVKVRRWMSKIPTGTWIFDRYAYDMLVDPLRFRIQLPRWIIRASLAVLPRPDLILCLGGNPEKIYARKPETTLEEVSRQVEELKDFCEHNKKRAVWIDTTVGMEESVASALSAIQQTLSRGC